MALNRRVQAPELGGPEPLRPTRAPADTFAAPARPVADDRLGQLAQSLGSFNENLLKFGNAYEVSKRYHNDGSAKTEADAFEQYKKTHTSDEFLQSIKDGTMPRWTTPQAQEAAAQTQGMYTAHRLNLDYQQKIADGSIRVEDGSAQAWLQQRREETLKANGWDEKSGQAYGFGGAFNQIFDNTSKAAVQAQIAQKKEAHDTAVFQQVEMFSDKAVQNKMDAASSWEQFTQLKKELQGAMHLQPKEADEVLMKALGRRMAVDPNWVVDMATSARPDVNGKGVIPPLSENPAFKATVEQWQRQALQFNAKRAETEAEQIVANDDANNFAKADGSFNMTEDRQYTNPVTGEKVTMSADKRRKEAIAAYETQSAALAQKNQETSIQRFDREAAVFIGNGVKREAWSKELNAAPGLANGTQLTNPDVVKRLVSSAQTYQALVDRSPAYAQDMVDDKARTFYQTFRVLKQYKTNPDDSPLSDQQALSAAGLAIRNDGPDTAAYVREQIVEANNHTSAIIKGNSFFGTDWVRSLFGADVSTATNKGQINTELRRLATAFVRAGGMSGKDAVELAAQELSKTGQVVNGQWMPKSGTMGLNFRSIESSIIDEYVKSPKGTGHDASNLVLQSAPGGRYFLTDRSGIPVEGGGNFSHYDLAQRGKRMETERQAEVIRQQNENATATAERNKRLDAAGEKLSDLPTKLSDWINSWQGSPDELIDQARKSGLDMTSGLGKSILEQQTQRKARMQRGK